MFWYVSFHSGIGDVGFGTTVTPAITLDTCYRSAIFQAFTLQSIKFKLSLWLLPIILFQTWDYTRRISYIYCTNHRHDVA